MIGLFDSGVGGLSVLKALVQKGIKEDFIYFGDTKNVPYGTKSKEEILSYTKEIMHFFIKKGVNTAIMACNTSSALVYEDLKTIFEDKIQILPLIQKTAPYFAKENGTIGVISTIATKKSAAYSKEILKLNNRIEVVELECQNFVEIVENRLYEDKTALKYIKEKMEYLINSGCKKVILGCTHFPYLVPVFKKFAPDIDFLDPALFLADTVEKEIKTLKSSSSFDFYVTGNPENFKKSGKLFFEIENDIKTVEFASI